jgi:transcriptional regulator with XRE-family HTH domain
MARNTPPKNIAAYMQEHGPGALNRLAEKAGINPNYLSQLKNGYKGMTYERALHLCAVEPSLDVLALMEESLSARKSRS